VPAEPVLVELPLIPVELPPVPDTFEVLRTWLLAVSQHCVLDDAPVMPEPDVPEPEEVCATAKLLLPLKDRTRSPGLSARR
jgi:hypothetical protein